MYEKQELMYFLNILFRNSDPWSAKLTMFKGIKIVQDSGILLQQISPYFDGREGGW